MGERRDGAEVRQRATVVYDPARNRSPEESEAQPSPPVQSQLSLLRNGPLLVLGFGHGIVDFCANTLPVFYPVLMARLNLSYASAGAMMTAQSTTASLSQPFFGWLSDRFGSRAVGTFSVVVTVVAIALVGFAPDYHTLLLVVGLLGLGIGAFHPQAAKSSTLLGGRWRTTSLSVYMVLGSAGYSLAPLLAATVLVPAGLRSTVVLLVPGLVMASLLFATLGRVDRLVNAGGRKARRSESAPIAWREVAALATVIVARSWVSYGLVTFLPLLYAARHLETGVVGQVLFLLFLLEGTGTALGGWLADRIGRKPTLIASFLLAAPLVHLFVGAGGAGMLLLALPLGLLLGSSITVTLAAAQEVLPARMGMASGLAISVGQIMGGAGVALQGLVADRYGLESSMGILVVSMLVAAVASLVMSDRSRSWQGS